MNQKTAANISDNTIRRFFLAQLSREGQSAFETALFTNSRLESRARLTEIALIDDYVTKRLSRSERAAFQQKFLVTAARQKKLEVSAALHRSLANDLVPLHLPAKPAFFRAQLAWRIAFAIFGLAILLASVIVVRREPQLVRRIIPKRLRPAAVVKPTPQTAHHAASSSESPVHRDEATPLPAHEASPQTFVLHRNSSVDYAPVVSLVDSGAQVVRLELMLERIETATFSILVTTGSGEVVHNAPEIRVEASDRIDFDVQIERLKPGDYQVALTRLTGDAGVAGTYYFRVQ